MVERAFRPNLAKNGKTQDRRKKQRWVWFTGGSEEGYGGDVVSSFGACFVKKLGVGIR